jgi:uncharacterized zinc-type alcohol dehydrogenase-like protein
VVVTIAFTGICHSDIHQSRDEWGGAIFPMVPGHEITGTVAAVGDEVQRFTVGDRVGVGVFVDSCRRCESCLSGNEHYCLEGEVATYNARDYDGAPTYGGYSESIVVDERYVLRVPDGLPLDSAAPLLCAGITVWSPLRHWRAGPGTHVAVVGMGGLGHMAVKLAHALGARVTVLSQSLAKQEDGLRMGADDYVATSALGALGALTNTFDLIINSTSANLDLDAYLRTLRLDATMVNVGLPVRRESYSPFSLAAVRRSLAASRIGSIPETQEMLTFCAERGITADIERVTVPDVSTAYDRVLTSDVRYRFVIDMATL